MMWKKAAAENKHYYSIFEAFVLEQKRDKLWSLYSFEAVYAGK